MWRSRCEVLCSTVLWGVWESMDGRGEVELKEKEVLPVQKCILLLLNFCSGVQELDLL